jgi:RNA polymerase sigma-70 factor (ECF subfamily)
MQTQFILATDGLAVDHGRRQDRKRVTSPTDHQLMLKVRDGEIANLGHLFERYHGSLYNFFVRLSGNQQLSEDLVQEVFFRMLKYRHAYRDNSQFAAWMYQIARHVRFDQLRKRQREVTLDEQEEPMSSDPGPGERIEKSQELALLRGALAKLSPEKREVLILSRFQRLKYEQIAEILGCEIGAVKVRVFRAIKDLRNAFLQIQGEKAS